MRTVFRTSILIAFFSIFGRAQTPLTLTLEQAVDMALAQNRQISLATDGVDFAKQQVREAKSALYPQINGFAGYTRNIKSPVFFSNIAPEPIRIGENNAMAVGFSVQQPIWLGGKVFTAREIANLTLENAREELQLTRENIVLEVTKTFYSVVLMQEILKVSEETLASAQSNFRNIVLLKREGVASEFDSLRARVRVSELEPEVIRARSNVETVTNALKFLLNINLEQPVEIRHNWQVLPPAFPEDEKQLALSNRRELSTLNRQREILVKVKKIERAEYLPSLYGSFNWQTQAQSADFDIQSNEKATTIDAGLSLSVPLFNGFRTSARVQQAQIDITRIDRQIAMLSENILMEVENNRLRVQEAQQRVNAQSESVVQAEKTLDIAKVRFRNGLSTQVELNDAETALARTRLSQLNAVYDFLVAKADYEKAIGR